MSLFYDLRRRSAKVLFVCQRDSDLDKIEEALLRADAGDVLEPSSALSQQITNLNLASFDVIVNLSGHPIAHEPGAYLLTAPIDTVEELVEFLAAHFRWAREWNLSAAAESQTTPVHPPAADLQLVVARAASV